MKESCITRPEDLDAALAGNAMYRRERLWRTAEGRSFPWMDLIAIATGVLLIFGGLYLGYFGQTDATPHVFIGLILFGGVAYRRQQAQIDALRELLKLSEGRSTDVHSHEA